MFDMTLPWVNFWSSVSNVVLVVGAFLVAAGTYGAIVMGSAKEHYANERIAANEAETARAKESAALAEKQAAEANERAAEATLKAEAERLERLKLEARLAPRSLTEGQQKNIAEKVRNFAPQSFQFITYQDDKECIGIANMIGRSLLTAGWSHRQSTSFLMVDLHEGVAMELTTENAERFRSAANALAEALNAEQIQATVVVNERITDHFDFIHIRVGKKP